MFLFWSTLVPTCPCSQHLSIMRHPPQLTLFAANSSTINVYGQKTLSLDLNVRREFIWTFLLASVKTPILGADFLHYFELVPDLRHKCFLDLKTKLQTTGHIKQAALHSVKTISSHETLYHDLLKSYPSITRLPGSNSTNQT
ncbi:peptidase A2 domain-containing protein [Trichonephila clavipes]|nr:peptidase A2 domain-containing protein [Trichonephila clavipes]